MEYGAIIWMKKVLNFSSSFPDSESVTLQPNAIK